MQTEQAKYISQLSETEIIKIETIQKILYKLCKEEYPELIKIAKLFLDKANNNYDNHIAIEGITGSGKSMFTLIIILLMHHISGLRFNMKKQTLFIPNENELRQNIRGLKPLAVYWIDEAIRALDKKRWYNQDQIELNHIIKTERWKRNTIMYCMPDFREFSNSFRTHNIFFRIYIVPRAAAIVNVKDIDKDVVDPWHTKINLKIKFERTTRNNFNITRYKAVMTSRERIEKEMKLPNYFTHSEFPDLSKHEYLKHIWEYYINLKEESRKEEKYREEDIANSKLPCGKKYKAYIQDSIKKEFENLGNYKSKKDLYKEKFKRYCSYPMFLEMGRTATDLDDDTNVSNEVR